MWLISSGTFELEHAGSKQTPAELEDQNLHSDSVRYLPESILAWTIALLVSYGFNFEVVHIG